jgi:hypothetical protein
LEQQLSLEEQQKWITKMLGYDFEIIYKKGKHNIVADAFSRKEQKNKEFYYVIFLFYNLIEWKKQG